LSRLATSFVLGYHGCDLTVAEEIINHKSKFKPSNAEYDWIGPGIYFWESDPQRALEWAKKYSDPAVIGAVIDLGNCLDLTNREDLDLLKEAHNSYINEQKKAGLEAAENKDVPGRPAENRLLRYLDCAVIKHLHYIIENQPKGPNRLAPYDTVRGMFTEGGELYPGAGFQRKSHTQISVINQKSIKGLFFPL
jgi:hypothetical protein